jgi:Transposase DNA-binding/Transposase DDE domain
MIYENDGARWAKQIFGSCNLEDPRRVRRLIDIASRLSNDPSGSLTRICRGDRAAQEGAYKFVENDAVRPEAIAEGMHMSAADLVADRAVCLAIQDTTVVDISVDLKDGWKEQGSPGGYQVHSTLLVDGQTLDPLGLLDQARWLRPTKENRPGKKTRSTRAPKDKESYKWTAALEAIEKRLSSMSNIISICDREADIYDFLRTLSDRDCRFVVRATHNRKIEESNEALVTRVSGTAVIGQHVVGIGQRGGQQATSSQQTRKPRQGREAITELRAIRVELSAPSNATDKSAKPIAVNAVLVSEPNPPTDTEGIRWLLLTTEPIGTMKQVLKVVEYYSARWLVEEFHKAWKSGCKMEQRRLQTHDNFERMMVITAAVAVRILQLRSLSRCDDESCEAVLSTNEWQCLFANTEAGQPLPAQPPSARWAYYALAKLAGWSDSKRTGRVGWQTLWTGWERLQFAQAGWRAAIQMSIIDRYQKN